MKKLLILILSFCFLQTTQAQLTHQYKDSVSRDADFQLKLKSAAYVAAKAFVSDTNAVPSVKMFSQKILTSITRENQDWLVPMGYYIMSIPETVTINAGSSIGDFEYAIPFIYQLFAKAWYQDIN